MFENNDNNRGLKLGLVLAAATAAVAGIALYIYYDDEVQAKLKGMVNREKAKYYVRHTLNGPDALVNAVDSLSDNEINTLAKLADRAQDVGKKTSNAFEQIMEKAKETAVDVTDRVQEYFD